MQLRIADVVRDQALLSDVQRAAELILDRYPESAGPLMRRWLGERSEYARV
jgi:ATP-dependent DNA helicase RecG